MKKTVAFELRTDTGNSVRDLEQMEKSARTVKEQMDGIEDATRNISKATRESAATENLEKLNRVVEDNVLGWQEMGQAVDTYRNIARAAGMESPIGQEALENAAKLEREMENLQTEVQSLSARGREMQAALQLGSGIVAGYSAFQGVTAMLGVENEKLLETITKLQAAQSVLMGVEELRMILERDSILMVQTRIALTKAQSVAMRGLTAVTGTTTAATKLFSKALVATGIGAIVAALGMLVANWDKVSKAIMSAIPGLEMVAEFFGTIFTTITDFVGITSDATREIDKMVEASEKISASADLQIQKLEALGGKEKEIYDLRLRALRWEEATLALKKKKNQATDEEIARLNELGVKIEILNIREDQRLAREKKRAEERERQRQAERKAKEKLEAEEAMRLREMQLQNSNDRLGLLKLEHERERAAIVEKYGAETELLKELKTQQDAELRAIEQEEAMRLREMKLQNSNDRLGLLKLEHEQERAAIVEKYGADTELLKELKIQQDAEVTALEEELGAAKKEQEEQRRQDEYERQRGLFELYMQQTQMDNEARRAAELEFLNSMYEQGLIATEQYNAGLERLNKERVEDEEQADMAIVQAKQMLVQESYNLFNALGQLMEEGSAAAKAFAGIQIAIDTAKAIASAIAGAAAAASQTGAAAAFTLVAYIASGVAAVLTAVGQAKQLLSKAGGSTPSVSAPTIRQPTTPTVPDDTAQGQGGNRVLAGANMTGAMPPQQVVVLASDVQDTNEENNNIDVVSTWG